MKQIEHPYKVGKTYFIRTVTNFLVGKLTGVFLGELVLKQAAWVADTGRFADALKNKRFNEVEPFPEDQDVIVNRVSVIDAVELEIKLPLEQK